MPVLYANAVFHTLDAGRPTAEALLAQDGRITALGTAAELAAHAPSGTTTVDLGGGTALPGFTDAHIHTASLARARHEVDMRGTGTLEEALDRLRGVLHRYAPGEWIFGGWWDFNRWAVPVQPTRDVLDALCPNNPVALTSIDGHTVWANTPGLRGLGITDSTPDPDGGEIVRDASGRHTGILRESAVFPVRALAASGLSGDLVEQLEETQRYLLSLGVTTVHDIDGADALAAYETLRAEGTLGIRLHKLLAADDLDAAIAADRRSGDGDAWIRHGAVKIFSDGAVGSHTCHMSEPFPGGDANYGMAVTAYPDLLALATKAATAGIAVAVHAIGDRANQLVLDAFGELAPLTTRHRLRHRIEHAQHLCREDVRRLAASGAVASMQPQHCPSDFPLMGMFEGRDLASYAWRSLLDAGARLAFGSDAPVEVPNPLHGIHAAATRMGVDGEPAGGWQPQERLTVAEAVEAYCAGPSYASGEEGLKGRLRPGMLADFVVLDTDILDAGLLAAEPARIHQARVLHTAVGGELRHSL